MAEDLHDLARVEHRMASIGAVQQVMRAVWALARAQQPRVESAAAEAAAYVSVAEAMVAQLVGVSGPALEELPPSDEVLWVLTGPERAFCGPLARMLLDQLPPTGDVGLVGTRLAEVASQVAELDARVVFRIAGASTPDELGFRTDALASAILEAPQKAVIVLHPTAGGPELTRALLLAESRIPTEDPPETFLPVAEVLGAAVLEAVAGRLSVALVEALRAEVRARLIAAEAARSSCDRRLEALHHQWRAVRQDTITQELIELTSGRRT